MGSTYPLNNGAVGEAEVSGDLSDALAGLNQSDRFHADTGQTIVCGIHSHILTGVVPMKAISDSDGNPSAFCVEHYDDGLLWLRGDCGGEPWPLPVWQRPSGLHPSSQVIL